jgi:GTP 3',8-cyclase
MVHLPLVEIPIVDHCNLTCNLCNHGSPSLPAHFMDVTELNSYVKDFMRIDMIRVIGGEPLLHPKIVDILKAIKSLGITKYIEVATNGLLLTTMASDFWSAVDKVRVSVYPDVDVTLPDKPEIILNHVPFFKDCIRENGEITPNIDYIYATCKIKNVCNTFKNERFYKCTRAAFMPLNKKLATQDGIRLDNLTQRKLQVYIQNEAPLEACYHCWGSKGATHPHSCMR